ncbi:MAG: YaeQ family protein [Gammaproteobacteria bacterium]|nr:YaeQ family protein [Gammaproteobacteria bacterium]
MALKATIFKADIQISDMDRHYYAHHQLTLARHPSETDQRMMMRLLAFILNASETLEFCKGLSTQEEPDLWQKNYTGEIELWIETGQPDEKRLRQASSRSQQVIVYTYSGHSAELWWERLHDKVTVLNNLKVINITESELNRLSGLSERNMQFQCTIEDRELWLTHNSDTIQLSPVTWK